jgi:hypothetical protein
MVLCIFVDVYQSFVMLQGIVTSSLHVRAGIGYGRFIQQSLHFTVYCLSLAGDV